MFCITIEHKSSCNTLCKNITNFLFWVLWTYLAMQKMNSLPNFFFWDIVKILQTYYFEYFENAWSCPAVMIVSPCRPPWCPKCWNQLVGNFDIYLHAKIYLSHLIFEVLVKRLVASLVASFYAYLHAKNQLHHSLS